VDESQHTTDQHPEICCPDMQGTAEDDIVRVQGAQDESTAGTIGASLPAFTSAAPSNSSSAALQTRIPDANRRYQCLQASWCAHKPR
jgi:hypothetical protein